jgi:hypothetical protein
MEHPTSYRAEKEAARVDRHQADPGLGVELVLDRAAGEPAWLTRMSRFLNSARASAAVVGNVFRDGVDRGQCRALSGFRTIGRFADE